MVVRCQAPTTFRSCKTFEIFFDLLSFLLILKLCEAAERSVAFNVPEDVYMYRNHRKLMLKNPSNAVQGQYIIVVSEDGVENVILQLENIFNGTQFPNEADSTFASATYNILTVNVNSFYSIASLLDDDDVYLIEQDSFLHLADDYHSEQFLQNEQTQYFPPWGLDRLDRAYGSLDLIYEYKYVGNNVDIFVIDSGIEVDSNDLTGRVNCELNLISGEPCDDFLNHGTAIASIAAGTIYGPAKNARIKAIKVVDKQGNATTSTAIKALDYISKAKTKDPKRKMVVNMSLGGSFSQAFNDAVNAAVGLGIVVVTASGNDNISACLKSPASASKAITVAASKSDDSMYSVSNFGPCVDIVAPGVSISSASNGGPDATTTKTGTSMAAAIVSGVAALYLEAYPAATPAEILNRMIYGAAANILQNATNYPNYLLSTEFIDDFTAAPATIPILVQKTRSPSPAPARACGGMLVSACTKNSQCCSGRCWRFNFFAIRGLQRCFMFSNI